MQLIRGLHNLSPDERGRAVTIGNFDGVHIGHQAILASLRLSAQPLGMPSTVVLFEPQPMEFFLGDRAPARLMRWHDKVEALRHAGIDEVLVLRFDEAMRSLTAHDFVERVLAQGLGCRLLIIGDDFRFGCDRQGDFAYLQKCASRYGYTVQDTPSVEIAGERISSTLLREALTVADFERVYQCLGHNFVMSGRVVQGDQLGRTLGVPTANILLRRQVSPLQGVYAVKVRWQPGSDFYAVANVGNRPTVAGQVPRLEVHLLDFSGDLYGKRLHVEFLCKLREEHKFASLEALKAAIAADIMQARKFFAQRAVKSL
ncbi:MAG: bifunctional riboflavin kinase/FAD synthetase [Pseudomonadales bacterium]|nr:bifunctional riboflavin kinase/FAD synthetase [Pseudomonadales bacterium]